MLFFIMRMNYSEEATNTITLPHKINMMENLRLKTILTTSAVRALVISPCTWITPSMGAIGCKSMATIRGRSLSLQIMMQKVIVSIRMQKAGRINFNFNFLFLYFFLLTRFISASIFLTYDEIAHTRDVNNLRTQA